MLTQLCLGRTQSLTHPSFLELDCLCSHCGSPSRVVNVPQVEADHWYLKANFTLYDNHYYCMPEGGAGYPHRPVRFLEHVSDKGNRPKRWDFDLQRKLHSWRSGSQYIQPPSRVQLRV